MATLRMNSAQGILSLLDEKDFDIKVYALKKLSLIVDQAWPEIANYISTLDEIANEPEFPEKKLAAFLSSKVFYHLQEYDQAVKLALEAKELFDLNERNMYVETIISKCIDIYIAQKT